MAANNYVPTTGGASGIGLAIVRRLLAEGGRVAAGDLDEARLGRLAAPFCCSFEGPAFPQDPRGSAVRDCEPVD